MSSFYSKLLKNVVGTIYNSQANANSNSVYADLMASARRAREQLIESNSMGTSLLSIMSAIPDLVTEASIRNDNDWYAGKMYESHFNGSKTELLSYSTVLCNDIEQWFNTYGTIERVRFNQGGFQDAPTIKVTASGNVYCLSYYYDSLTGAGYLVSCYTEHIGEITDLAEGTCLLYINDDSEYSTRILVCNDIMSMSGEYFNFLDILKSLVQSSELNSAMLRTVDLLINKPTADAASLGSLLSGYSTGASKTCVDFIRSAISALIANGPYGCIIYVLNYYKALTTVQVTAAQTLTFTDDENLVPSSYYDGIIGVIGSVVGAVSNALLMVGQYVVGAIGAVIGTGMQVIAKVLGADPSVTRARMITLADNLVQVAPFAFGQSTCTNNEQTALLDELFVNGETVRAIEVPGGILLYGKASDENSGYIYEFHPDLHNRCNAFPELFDNTHSTEFEYKFVGPSRLLEICSEYNDSETAIKMQNEFATGRLSSNGDLTAAAIMSMNTLLYCLYCLECMKNYSGNTSYNLTRLVIDYNTADTIRITSFQGTANVETLVTQSSVKNSPSTALATIMFSGVYWLRNFYNGASATMGNRPMILSVEDFADVTPTAAPGAWDTEPTVMGPLSRGIVSRPGKGNLLNHLWYGYPIEWPASPTYVIESPFYTSQAFWTTMVVTGVIALVVTAITVAVVLVVRSVLNTQRLKMATEIEEKYEAVKANPNEQNIKDYKMACLKNNLFTSVFGGTKYSQAGLWADVTGAEMPATDGASNLLDTLGDSLNADPTVAFSDTNSLVDMSTLYGAIVGSHPVL